MTFQAQLKEFIIEQLSSTLPVQVSEEFGVDEELFTTFLTDFLTKQLEATTTTKGTKSTGKRSSKKDPNKKTKTSGWLQFSKDMRPNVVEDNKENEEYTSLDAKGKLGFISKELGKLWSNVSESEKTKWNKIADDINKENGIESTSKKPAAKRLSKLSDKVAALNPKKGVKKPEDTVAKQKQMEITRKGKFWMVKDTEFVIDSAKTRMVLHKLVNNKIVELSEADIKLCKSKGWAYKIPVEEETEEHEQEKEEAKDEEETKDVEETEEQEAKDEEEAQDDEEEQDDE